MADKAIISRITIEQLPEGKTLNLGKALGYTFLVGKDAKIGDLYLLFEDGLQLSEEFAQKNDLIARKDSQGNRAGGYFEQNRRVKAKKFMKIRSEVFACPLDYLKYTGYNLDKLKEGDLIEDLNGHPICNKYYTRATLSKRNGPSRRELRGQTRYFPKHMDTEQFRHYVDKIPDGARIYFTEKVHGTSQRVGNVLEEIPLKWWHKVCLILSIPLRTREYQYVVGTRNVICSDDKVGFHSNKLRNAAASPFLNKLHKGEVVYYEVVGYDGDAPIMPAVSTVDMKDKEVQKKYGDTIVYNYGLPKGEFDVYVYRVSWINEDGIRFELPWEHVKKRCVELGVKHVKEHNTAITREFRGEYPILTNFHEFLSGYEETHKDAIEALSKRVNELSENHDNGYTHPNEGIVIRWEKGPDFGLYKHKSFLFKVLEGICKEDDSYIDTEEIS